MEEIRVAKAFLAKVNVRAEKHLAELAASIDDDLQNLPMAIQLDPSSPQYHNALQTVTLQVCHAMAFQQAGRASAQQQKQQELAAIAALQPVLDSSFGQVDTALARQQDLATVSDSITAVAAQYLGSDNATCVSIQHAFVSMFTAASLPRLANLAPPDREAQLRQLADICMGICLFNDCNLEGVSNQTFFELEQPMQLVEGIKQSCSALQHDVREYNDAIAHRSSSEPPHEAEMVQLTGQLAYLQQAHLLCQSMQDNLSAAMGGIRQQQSEQEAGLRELQRLVGGALAVERQVVQPAFAAVGRRHVAMLQAYGMLQQQPALVAAVFSCIEVHKPQLPKELAASGATNSILPLAPMVDDSLGPKDPINLADAEAASGSVRVAAAEAGSSGLSLAGFCPVSFVKRAGLLVHADPALGFVRYDNQLLGCASQEFLNWFAASPKAYLRAVTLQVLIHPACLAPLNLLSAFKDLSLDKLIASVASEPDVAECECQTELHIVAKHIDRKYEWNEWEHRRKALAMVNLRQKRTHGSQTILSHFRRENATQVWLPKGVASQTRVNKGQSMPRKLRHVAGLRGAPGSQMTVLNLELDLGQSYQQ